MRNKIFQAPRHAYGAARGMSVIAARGVSGIAACLLLLGVAGCDRIDPLKKPYVWKPEQVNRSNIAAMAANPNDLVEGRGTGHHRRSSSEVFAIERVMSGKQLDPSGLTALPTGGN